MNANERRFVSLELNTIHNSFYFNPWLTGIYHKTKFQPCYSKIVQAPGKMNSIEFFYGFYFSGFSTPRTRMPCGAYVDTPSRGVTLGDFICGSIYPGPIGYGDAMWDIFIIYTTLYAPSWRMKSLRMKLTFGII